MPTQVTGRYIDLYTWNNLYAAYRQAARGKRSHGPAARFEFHLEDNLVRLQEELAQRPGLGGPADLPLAHLAPALARCYNRSQC